MANKEEIRKDFLAFTDNDSDVLIDSSGEVMYYKNASEQLCKIITNADGNDIVEYLGQIFPYRMFIAKQLARLDIFATRILEKRKRVEAFVDGPAKLKTVNNEENSTALKLLKSECDNFSQYSSKINFITADAGHGKSALLKEFQILQAERYLKGESSYLFWHVDLQGRDLVRLPEAIMFDLGELRMPGLYYPSIINLVQKRFIILAIDGFDELAAEIGGMNAVSSLSSFVNEMNGQGTLIAASRRTFFDTQDYLKRTSLLKNKVPHEIIFNELKLTDWTKNEAIKYFENLDILDPESIYDRIETELHNSSHPILTKPFLLTKLMEAIDGDAEKIPEFFSKKGLKNEGVAIIVEAFTNREVDKWKERDTQTGKSYLTFQQHIFFLAMIAKEMWETKKEFATLDEIEFYTVMLLDEWRINESVRPVILRLVNSHAFLIPLTDSRFEARKFDHEEFRNYFLSRALAILIDKSIELDNYSELKKFLYVDQLSDSVALYCFNYVKKLDENVHAIILAFKKMINDEWKPTYLQMNIGTLLPFMMDKINFEKPIVFDSKVNYTSLVFENKHLRNVTFKNGNFIKISFRDTILENVHFENCEFNEINIEVSSKNKFENVSIKNYNATSITLLKDGEVNEIAYSPQRIIELFVRLGIKIYNDEAEIIHETTIRKNDFKKSVNRFIIKFNKMIIQYEKNIVEERYFGNDSELIIEKVIPLLLQFNIIEEVETKQSKHVGSKAWRLLIHLEDLMKYDEVKSDNQLSKFWEIVNSKNTI